MTYPNIPDKYKYPGTTAAIDIFLKNNKVDSLSELPPAPRCCILCPSEFPIQYLGKKNALKQGPKIIKPIHFLNKDVAIFTGFIGFGAPIWVWALEQLIAYGIKDFIYLGFFGKVNPSIVAGSIIVVEKALRDEGSSYHYSAPSKWAYPDEKLTKKLLSNKGVVSSAIWTTDGMFKQTRKEIDYAKSQKIAGFDMETSALFCVTKSKKCRIASIQVESDSFISDSWKARYAEKEFNEELEKAIDLSLAALTD